MSDRIAFSMSYALPALRVATQEEASQIDEQMAAAREKADQAMDSAITEMAFGIAGGLVSVGGAASSVTAAAPGEQIESKADSLGALARMVPAGGLHASAAMNIQHDAESKKAEEADAQGSAAKEHTSRVRDAISDLLQKLAEMNASTRLLG